MNERLAGQAGGQTTIRLDDQSDQNPFNSKVLKEKSEFPETAIDTYRSAIKPESPPEPVVAKPKRTNSAWGRDKYKFSIFLISWVFLLPGQPHNLTNITCKIALPYEGFVHLKLS